MRMDVEFGYKPMPIQVPFHESSAYERVLVGAMGSGKSYAVIAEAIAWCLEQPGIRGAICRKTIPELRLSVEPIFKQLIPSELWSAGKQSHLGGHLDSYQFANGSIIYFISLDDWTKHRGLNLGFLAFDELNLIDLDSYNGMLSRVRQRDITAEAKEYGYTHEITRRGVFGSTNPSGHDWIWQRFHPDSKDRMKNTEIFFSTTLDNPHLPPEYLESLLSMPSSYVRRFVLCSFEDFAGMIYEDWTSEHIVPRPRIEDRDANTGFWMSVDPGTMAPTAALWVQTDPDRNRLIGIAEYEMPGLAVPAHAANWRRIEAEKKMRVTTRIGDPGSITQRDRGTMLPLQTQYQKQGFTFQLGSNDQDARIISLGTMISQHRFVLTEDCPLTFEAIKQYQWKELSPAAKRAGEEGKATVLKKNTHLVECAQYLSQRITPGLSRKEMQRRLTDFDAEVHQNIRRQMSRTAQRRRRGAAGPMGYV
jgi:PBSX family phage terminase large subunit